MLFKYPQPPLLRKRRRKKKMKRKALLLVAMLVVATVVPLLIIGVQATLNAGPDQEVRADQTVTFNGSTTDNMTLVTQVTWDFGDGTTPVNGSSVSLLNTTHVYTLSGVYNATLTVKFGPPLNKTDTDIAVITVLEDVAPVVNAGPDLTVEQESHNGTEVTLNGTATDNVSTRFNFTWSENGVVLAAQTNVTFTTLAHTFNLGEHVVTLNATDQAGNTGSDEVKVTVIDTRPPELTVVASPRALWPPNHKYVTVRINVTAFDICDPSPNITFVSITSNEPENALGDGNTINDIVIIDNFTFSLRAERSGKGSGRIYTVTYKATDRSGNEAVVSVTIEVPHNQ
jgi:PKD domain